MLENLKFNKKIGFHLVKIGMVHLTKSFDLQVKIIKKTDLRKNSEFYRDSDKKKLEMLNQITDSTILPSSKITGTPSDVWAVKKDEKKDWQKN